MKILRSNQEVLLAFEYGTILAETARDMKIELTSDLMKRAEEVIEHEFNTRSPSQLACNMVPVILSIFETN